jgi:hypothetical protein
MLWSPALEAWTTPIVFSLVISLFLPVQLILNMPTSSIPLDHVHPLLSLRLRPICC